jgi:sodium ion-translocating decarboxylase beta subunit
MWQLLVEIFTASGFGQFAWGNGVMILIGLVFIFLAVKKGFEPLLLVPIGFGILMGNIPYNLQNFSASVYDGPVSERQLTYYTTVGVDLNGFSLPAWTLIENTALAKQLVLQDRAVMVDSHRKLAYHGEIPGPAIVDAGQGREVLVVERSPDGRYPMVVPPAMQDPWNASVLWFLYRGIEFGFYPPLIFLGVGALTDFGPLLANPRSFLLGAAAQFGIFGSLLAALLLNFSLPEAASIGIIGGADGPTAIFVASKLAPDLLGAVALSAYSYMAMVPIIQPPIMRLLTTKEERLIRMVAPREVSRELRIAFPIAGFLLTAFIANAALPLLGMLFFGNLLRESMVTDRLAKTASTSFVDIITILLGLTVGAKTQAGNFLTVQTLGVFLIGIVAFSLATAAGVMGAKLMNKLSSTPINPLIGAAGVSAVPMAARVCHRVAQEEDPQNYLLMHAMGPNVAGVIGSAVAAGVLLSYLS